MYLHIENGQLQIELRGWEIVWSLKRRFSIPIKNVASATTTKPTYSWMELRVPGTFIPGVIKAGTYFTKRGKEFWYVTRNENTITIELKGHSYKRIILSTDDNIQYANMVNRSLRRQ